MRNMKIFLLFIVAISFGCATLNVTYDYDQQADFSLLKTYDWLPVPEKARKDDFTLKHVKFSMNKHLEAKGYSLSPSPDFLIATHSGREKKVDIQEWGYVYGERDYYHGSPYWIVPDRTIHYLDTPRYDYEYRSGIDRYEYEVGTLIIDFIDAKTKELIWRGTATGVIDPNQKSRDMIDKAVSRILENFPPMKNK